MATQTDLLVPSEPEEIKSVPAVTTSELTHRLYRKFETSEDSITEKYIVATQVRPMGSHGDSTADAVIVGNWPSVGHEIQGFEIKVSRSDWLNEVKAPNKCWPTKQYCDRWWLLIASESMVKDGELPEDWGMMVAHAKGIKIVKPAPKLTPVPIQPRFISGLMRANKRGHIPEDVHAQYLNDAKREAEAKAKKEHESLRTFVKFIHEAFGIELRQEKKWVRDDAHPHGAEIKEWVAKVRNKYNTYDADQLKALIESAVSGDLEATQKKLRSAHDDAQAALEILDKYKDFNLW